MCMCIEFLIQVLKLENAHVFFLLGLYEPNPARTFEAFCYQCSETRRETHPRGHSHWKPARPELLHSRTITELRRTWKNESQSKSPYLGKGHGIYSSTQSRDEKNIHHHHLVDISAPKQKYLAPPPPPQRPQFAADTSRPLGPSRPGEPPSSSDFQ